MFHLIIEYHAPRNKERHEEYLTCLRENLKNPLIGKIHIFLESNRKRPPLDDPKIVYAKAHKKSFVEHKKANTRNYSEHDKAYLKKKEQSRSSYSDYFRYARENLHGENCIIANSDIFFDETLGVIDGADLKNTLICLSRWDIKEDGTLKFYDRPDSQDSWIFTSPMNEKVEEEASFFLGRMGCDNLIAWIAHSAGLKLTNPAHQIIARHLHLIDYRTYVKYGTVLEKLFFR